MKEIQGKINAEGLSIGLVCSRFNDMIVRQLLQGAKDSLIRYGAAEQDLHVVWVPGAYELPLAAQTMAESGRYHALVCLGAIIKGATPHFDFVAAEASKGIASASLKTAVPMGFGVLTTHSLEQALERAGTKAGNKGADAAASALEMVSVIRKLKERS